MNPMTPEKKADELIEKFYKGVQVLGYTHAKECAIVFVDEMIEESLRNSIFCEEWGNDKRINANNSVRLTFWTSVEKILKAK